MKVNSSNTQSLKWEFPKYGLFEACIVDGKIADVRMLREGCNTNGPGLWCSSPDPDLLRAIHKSLGELLEFVETLPAPERDGERI